MTLTSAKTRKRGQSTSIEENVKENIGKKQESFDEVSNSPGPPSTKRQRTVEEATSRQTPSRHGINILIKFLVFYLDCF